MGQLLTGVVRQRKQRRGQCHCGGVSAGGITQRQMEQLKTRLEDAKAKLQAAQANPNAAQTALQGLTGERISGDLLTAPMWSWLAGDESHARLSQSTAGVVQTTGNTYGLFHALANPIYSWGVVRRVTFPGVNIDIASHRMLVTAKDNDEKTWIAYNRIRGQYGSALEHAVPEKFFNDPVKCNSYNNPNPIAGLPSCPQGISSMKALSLAAAQGQKIHTITQEVYQRNPNIVSTSLSGHSDVTRNRIQNALAQGMEVTIHERQITESGWKGAGYVIIDPQTGSGAYEIEGGAQGGALFFLVATFVLALIALGILAWLGPFAILGYGWALMAAIASAGAYLDAIGATVNWSAVSNWIGLTLAIIGAAIMLPALGIALTSAAAIFAAIVGLITAIYSVLT